MKELKYIVSFLAGFLGGWLYFHHLYVMSYKAIMNKKKKTGFIFRFLPFVILSVTIAYFFKEGIIIFLAGFYISRLTYTKLKVDFN